MVVRLWPWLILATAYGACVGSFLNVVICRLPQGRSLWGPPSYCPNCEQKVAWYDNVPVLAWLYLHGRCRSCHSRISIQYPLVEIATAVLFAGVFSCYYMSDLRPDFAVMGLEQTWPVLIVHLVLVAALLAASVIDARFYIIPLDIPNTVWVMAMLSLPLAAVWLPLDSVVSQVSGQWMSAAAGGLSGLIVALLMLWMGVLPQSFDEPLVINPSGAHDVGTPEQWLAHPHPRREILKECLFVVWPLVGAAAAFAIVPRGTIELPLAIRVGIGVVWGYLVGGALVWAIRIMGTLGFGKEAMGLGDVHLLAAIGAVLGWFDAIVIFFLAPFVGLAGTALVAGIGRLATGQVRVVPYGPFLAVSTVVWMVLQGPLREFYGTLFVWPQ